MGFLDLSSVTCGLEITAFPRQRQQQLQSHTRTHLKPAILKQSGSKGTAASLMSSSLLCCDKRGLARCKFQELGNIFTFFLATCANDVPRAQIYYATFLPLCACVRACAFLAGAAYGSVYFLSLSRKADTPPLTGLLIFFSSFPSSHLCIDSGRQRLHFHPRGRAAQTQLWLQFEVVRL